MNEERNDATREPAVPTPGEAVAGGGKAVMDRRSFLRGLLGDTTRTGVGAGVIYGILGLRRSGGEVVGTRGLLGIVRPPGSQLEDEFLASCLRCTRCADACPTQCVRFFGPEAGKRQATPYILTGDKACTLCFECGRACPTEAIGVLERFDQAKMGIAVVDERLCVSHNGTGVCGACHTICPLRNRAITQDYRNAPSVHADACTGCGLCEEVCIVRDRRAIRVQTDRVVAKTSEREAAS